MAKRELKGLNEADARKRLDKYGFNEIKDIGKTSYLEILLRQIKNNFIIYLLLLAAILSFFVGKLITAYVILVVILVVIFTGFIQEYRAEKAIEKLKDMVMQFSIVVRGGVEYEIPTREIVPGDLLVLRTGERIPADCVIFSSKNLLVNESVLTGESDEVVKTSIIKPNKPKDTNLLFAGSFIVDGKCVAEVISTGMNTKFGKIASMISRAEKELPLQKKVNTISKYMAAIGFIMAVLIGVVVFFYSTVSDGFLIEIIILVIAVAVSAFPEGFPVVLITTLSLGVYRMAQKNVIVNRMSIIETLGETTIICSDKTGTITKGEMTVKKIFFGNKIIDVTGIGYEGVGDFLFENRKIDLGDDEDLNILFKTAVLCNDSVIKRTGEDKIFQIMGAPTEAALLVMASKAGIYKEDFNSDRINEIPFSSERKMMSVLCKEKNKKFVYSKGALEYLLKRCKFIQNEKGVFRLSDKDRKKILSENKKFTTNSLRTLGFAYKGVAGSTKEGDFEKDLIFIGVVGMEDPPREGIKETILMCQRAGIKVKMVTGDDRETALSISRQIGMDSGKILEGAQIDKLKDKDLFKIVKQVTIFSRVRPEHKLRIVKALKKHGEIVTVTGDGVNDAPALKEAHVGVAMGKNGTDVSRSVSDLTLRDDNFVTLVGAIREGRTIFNNLRKFVTYQLSCNYSELMILFFGVLLVPFLGWPIPILLALQILFMNIVTDNLPAITLGLNKSSDDIMNEKPRKKANILNKNLFILLVFAGSIMALFTLSSFFFAFNVLGQTVKDARSTALLTLIVLEIAGAFNFRSFRKKTLNRSFFVNPYLSVASIISLIATILIIYTPLNKVFETVPLPLVDWLIAFGFALVFILIFDSFKKMNTQNKILKLEH